MPQQYRSQLIPYDESFIENAATSAGPVPRSLHAIIDVAHDLTVLELGPNVLLRNYQQSLVQSLLPTINNIEVLRISLNVWETPVENELPQLFVNSYRYPKLHTLVLKGVCITGVNGDLSTLRHLELYDWPSLRPLEIFPFMDLLNTAQNLKTLRLDQYLHSVCWDLDRCDRVYRYGVNGQPVPRMEKFYLPLLEKLTLRGAPEITSAFLQWMDHTPKDLEVIGVFGNESLSDRKPTLFSCMLFPLDSRKWPDLDTRCKFQRARLSVGNELSATLTGPDGARLCTKIDSNQYDLSQGQERTKIIQDVFTALGGLINLVSQGTWTVEIVGLRDPVNCLAWYWILKVPKFLHELIVHQDPMTRDSMDCVVNLFRQITSPDLVQHGAWVQRIEVHGVPYTDALFQCVVDGVEARHKFHRGINKLTLNLRDPWKMIRPMDANGTFGWMQVQPRWRELLGEYVTEVQASRFVPFLH